MHRWIQVTAETVEEWTRRENKLSENDTRGYAYVSADNKNMVEFHVDDLDLLHEYATTAGVVFGGNPSVQKTPDTKPLMISGQDESVYNPFLLRNWQWVAPGGQRALL